MPDSVADMTEAPLEVNAETDLSKVEDLEAVVDQLVAEIDQTVGEIEMSRSDPEARPVDEGELLSGDAVLTDAGENDVMPTSASPADEASDESAAEGVEDDAPVESQAEQLMEDVSGVIEEFDASAGVSAPSEPDAAPEGDGADELSDKALGVCEESIEALDQRLSEDAESELEGDFETLDGEFESFEPAGATTPAPVPESSEVRAGEPESVGVAGDAVAAAAPTAAAPTEPVAEIEATPATPRQSLLSSPVVARVLGMGRRVAEPAGDVMSLPLRKLDPSLRDTVGWVAVNTLFIAVCVWLFLLLR